MRIVYTLVFTLIFILYPIELSAQLEGFPHGDPLPGMLRSKRSSSSSPGTQQFPSINLNEDEPFMRARSRSPPASFMTQPTCIAVSHNRKYSLDHLETIQLNNYDHPHWSLELRRYTFPSNKSINVIAGRNIFDPVPNQGQIVLSTSHGDVFAILVSSDTLSGIYAPSNRKSRMRRAKINMETGVVTSLTSKEIDEIPVGSHKPIVYYFKVQRVNRFPTPLIQSPKNQK